MAFLLTGRPDTNPLFNNPVWAGKPIPLTPDPADPQTFPSDWHNYGGDKIWPSEQSDWPKRQPVGWLPDPSFDTSPYRVSRLPAGLRLSGPVSPYFGVKVVRDITLPPGAPSLVLRDMFFKSERGSPGLKAFPIGIWSISQVRGDSTVYLPLNKNGLFPRLGLTPLGDSKKPMPDGRTTATFSPSRARPISARNSGWMTVRGGWLASTTARCFSRNTSP